MDTVARFASAGYGLLFVAAVLAKLDGWPSWSSAVEGWLPRRPAFARALRWVVPQLEGLAAVLAFTVPRVGLLVSALVLVLLAVGIGVLRPSHRGEECNCFGAVAASRIGAPLAARNLVLAAVAFAGFFGSDHVRRLSGLELVAMFAGLLLVIVSAESLKFYLSAMRRLRSVG
jgi:hypothetical protein